MVENKFMSIIEKGTKRSIIDGDIVLNFLITLLFKK